MNTERNQIDAELDRLLGKSAPVVPSPLERRITEQMQRNLRPVQPLRSTAALTSGVMLVFLALGAAFAVWMHPLGLKTMTKVQLSVATAILLASALCSALSLAWQMRPGSLRSFPSWVPLAIPITAFVAATVLLFPMERSEAFVTEGSHCLIAGLAIAVLSIAAFWPIVRGGAISRVKLWGTTLGVLAGLTGASALQYSCELQNATHLAVWHGGILLVSIGIGTLGGYTWQATRAGIPRI